MLRYVRKVVLQYMRQVVLRYVQKVVLRYMQYMRQVVLLSTCRGWPPALSSLKGRMELTCGDSLPPEHPGSKWPKTTLAALKQERRLLPEQLAELHRICDDCQHLLRGPDLRVLVDKLSVVLYQCRCVIRPGTLLPVKSPPLIYQLVHLEFIYF